MDGTQSRSGRGEEKTHVASHFSDCVIAAHVLMMMMMMMMMTMMMMIIIIIHQSPITTVSLYCDLILLHVV